MFSRAALNGAELNAVPFGAGGFVHDAAASDAIALAESATLVRRVLARSTDQVEQSETAELTRRVTPAAADDVTFGHAATLVRRVLPTAVSLVVFDETAPALSWYFRQAAPHHRTVMVGAESRAVQVPADRRRVDVTAEDSAEISVDRREFA